jgi:diazepam-binding inhibitor (GABA receptor modulating acyl-CoA-binding protein)
MLDLKSRAKWEAWNDKRGQSKEAAMQAYIALVEKLQNKYA